MESAALGPPRTVPAGPDRRRPRRARVLCCTGRALAAVQVRRRPRRPAAARGTRSGPRCGLRPVDRPAAGTGGDRPRRSRRLLRTRRDQLQPGAMGALHHLLGGAGTGLPAARAGVAVGQPGPDPVRRLDQGTRSRPEPRLSPAAGGRRPMAGRPDPADLRLAGAGLRRPGRPAHGRHLHLDVRRAAAAARPDLRRPLVRCGGRLRGLQHADRPALPARAPAGRPVGAAQPARRAGRPHGGARHDSRRLRAARLDGVRRPDQDPTLAAARPRPRRRGGPGHRRPARHGGRGGARLRRRDLAGRSGSRCGEPVDAGHVRPLAGAHRHRVRRRAGPFGSSRGGQPLRGSTRCSPSWWRSPSAASACCWAAEPPTLRGCWHGAALVGP